MVIFEDKCCLPSRGRSFELGDSTRTSLCRKRWVWKVLFKTELFKFVRWSPAEGWAAAELCSDHLHVCRAAMSVLLVRHRWFTAPALTPLEFLSISDAIVFISVALFSLAVGSAFLAWSSYFYLRKGRAKRANSILLLFQTSFSCKWWHLNRDLRSGNLLVDSVSKWIRY